MTYPWGKSLWKLTCPAKNSNCPGLPHETFFESCDHPQWTYYSYNLLLPSVTVLLFHKLKLLQNTPGVKTYLKPRSKNSSVGIQCVETLSAFKIPIWRLFHWDMLAIWLLCCMANLERITNILKNMPSCFFICHWDLGCVFWENPDLDFLIQKRILRFWSNPITNHESITSALWVDSGLDFCRSVCSVPGRSAARFPNSDR